MNVTKLAASNVTSRRTFEATIHSCDAVASTTILDVTSAVYTTHNVVHKSTDDAASFFARVVSEATR